MKNVLRYAIYAGIFATPFIVFLVTGSLFFPFITGKNFAFRIIVEIMTLAWIALAIIDPQYRPRRSWILGALGVFVVIIGVADMVGVNFFRSFWSNFERMEGFITLLHMLAYVCVVGTVMKTRLLWRALFITSVVASMGVAISAFSQLTQGITRVDATLGNSTYLAVYMLVHIFLAGWLLYQTKNNTFVRVVYGIAILAQVIVLYLTATRGTLLGLVGGLGLCAVLMAWRGKEYPRLRTFSYGSIALMLILVGGFLAIRQTSFVQDNYVLKRFADISLQDATTQSRIVLWTRVAWDGFKERPILGWGQDNFIQVFGTYYDPILYKQEPWFDRAHNVFFDWLIAGGLLGFLGYISLFGAGVYLLWKRETDLDLFERVLFTGMLAAYFVHNLFVFDNLISYILFATMLAFIHSRSIAGHEDDASSRVSSDKGFSPGQEMGIGAGAIVALVVLIYIINVPGIHASRTLIHALQAQQRGDFEIVFNDYTDALSERTMGTYEIREQLANTAVQAYHASGGAAESVRPLLVLAENELNKSIAEEPLNSRHLFFLGYFFRSTGRLSDAYDAFARAHELSPGRPSLLIDMATTKQAMGMRDDAVALARQAFELETENDAARITYATMLFYAGDDTEADTLLVEGFGTTAVDDDALLHTYIDLKKDDRVLAIMKERADMGRTNDTQFVISLAVAYLNAGYKDEALSYFEQAISMDASFTQQGTEIIKQIQSGQITEFR